MLNISFEKRLYTSPYIRVVITAIAILLSFVVGGMFLFAVGVNPFSAYASIGGQIFMTSWGIEDLLLKMSPLMLTGIAVALAAKMRVWNIGAEGQIYMGACGATWAALHFGAHLSAWVMLPLMFALSLICGALWMAIPAILKSRFNVNDIITTLLMNYIAINWVNYLLFGAWRDPNTSNFPITAVFAESTHLPTFGDTRLHIGFLIGLFIIILTYFILAKTKFGLYVKITGSNPDAAEYSGINQKNLILLLMLMSGAVAGLAGMFEVCGIHHRLQQHISIGYGYTGIIVAWLSRNHPLGIIFNAFFLAAVFVGGEIMQLDEGIPVAMVYLFQGIILFLVLGAEVFGEYKLKIKKVT
jgi:general nucleoside transport system permease protein